MIFCPWDPTPAYVADDDFQFGGVASPGEVVDVVHRAQRDSDSAAPVAPAARWYL
jgi:hypothetical protein